MNTFSGVWLAMAATGMAGAASAAPQVRFDRTIAEAKTSMQTDAASAHRMAALAGRQASAIADKTRRDLAVATAEWLQGEAYLQVNETYAAAPHIARAGALVRAHDGGSSLAGNILLSSGGVHGNRGEVAAALADYQAAHAIFQRIADTRNQAKALMLIAALYGDGNDYEAALRYLGQALDTYRDDPFISIAIYNNRASYLQDLGQYDEAEEQYRAALALAGQLNSPLLRARVLGNMARTWLKADDIPAAANAMRQAILLSRTGDASAWRPQLLAIAASIALRQGDRALAGRYVEERFAGVDPATTTLSYREAHQAAYETYGALGQPEKALVHLAALKRLDDQATKLATTTNTALMAARFDFANQELRISKLKADELQRSVAYERAQARTQRWIFVGAAVAVAIVIALLAFALVTIRRSRDRVAAANADLAVTNGALGKALAAKTEFLATTSHEIRTPLNGILGMTQVMLADRSLAPALRDRLDVVHGAGVTMRALVDDILDVAKMETGNLTIEHAPFDLCATVTDATRMWEEQARAKGLTFDIDMAACPAMILGDPARVRQIVFNLLSNALKFTPSGRIGLSVRNDGDMLRLAIADSGIGIPADRLEDIFESFRQADAGTTRQFGGTGLGLTICRNLARAMDGDVTVESTVGKGTTFVLTLPLVHAQAACEPAVATDAQATLVVDRNPITRSMFRVLLSPHGGPVEFAGGIDEAVARLAAGGIARVLIDDATARVETDMRAGLAQIAAVAGDASTTLLWPVSAQRERDELLATGMSRVVAKPVSGGALVAALFGDDATNRATPRLVSQAA